jgi:hypothetical protein
MFRDCDAKVTPVKGGWDTKCSTRLSAPLKRRPRGRDMGPLETLKPLAVLTVALLRVQHVHVFRACECCYCSGARCCGATYE